MDLHFDEHNNQSLKRFEKMLKTDAVYFFDSAEFERIIHFYIDTGKANLARKAIALGLEQHPDFIGLRLSKAELLILEDELIEAKKILNEIEAIEPHNEEVFIQKALLFSKQELHQEAIQSLEKALEYSEEDSIDILSLISMEYLFLEDFERAILYFKNCLEIDLKDYTSLFNIVYCYDMLEKPEKAIGFLQEHIDNDPYSETAWHQLGRQFILIDNPIEALKAFDYAILIDEQFIGAYLEKAKTLENLKRYEEAIGNYLITTELDDPTAYAYLRIGSCFETLNDTEKAKEFYMKSYEQDPYLDKPIIALSDLFFNTEDYQKSLYYINKLLEIDNKNSHYWKLYAQSNSKLAFFEEAAKAYKKCLTLDDKSLEVYLALADTLYFIGDYKDAIDVLEIAEKHFIKRAEIAYKLSGLYFLMKKRSLGLAHLKNALHLNPQKYKDFQKLFPTLHNSREVRAILDKIRNN